jgi:hypothetical protein
VETLLCDVGVIRHTPGATTALSLVVGGGLLFDQFVPAGLRQYRSGWRTATPDRVLLLLSVNGPWSGVWVWW